MFSCRFGRAVLAVIALATPHLMGYASGPDPRLSGAPGEADCSSCHGGGKFKASVQISFSGDGASYAPGVKQTITVSFANGDARVYGFELSARISGTTTQAGDFVTPAPSGIQVLCAIGAGTIKPSGKTCTNNALQFIEHNRPISAGKWSFDWIPPATASGPIAFYLAGNAANGDGSTSGDSITTASATLTSGTPTPPKPSISSNGVVTSFNQRAGSVAAGWLEIHGADLITGAARDWSAADFANGTPTALDGVSVTVNGKAAFVRHISATEIDVQSPTDNATGPVQVVVTSGKSASDPFTVQQAAILPAICAPFKGTANTYALGLLSDGTYAAPAGAIAKVNTRPVAPGETVTFFGTGFGPVATFADASDIPAGSITSSANMLANPVTIQIGSVQIPAANILYQGLALDAIGLYQFIVVLPSSLTAGDQAITFSVGGVDTAQTMFITVKAASEPSQ